MPGPIAVPSPQMQSAFAESWIKASGSRYGEVMNPREFLATYMGHNRDSILSLKQKLTGRVSPEMAAELAGHAQWLSRYVDLERRDADSTHYALAALSEQDQQLVLTVLEKAAPHINALKPIQVPAPWEKLETRAA